MGYDAQNCEILDVFGFEDNKPNGNSRSTASAWGAMHPTAVQERCHLSIKAS